MQAIPAMVPLLDLSLTQTNAQGAYVYRFQRSEGTAQLTASAGLSVDSSRFQQDAAVRIAREHFVRNAPLVLHEGAWMDERFRAFPEFERHHFEGVASIPLTDAGQVVGVVNVCRIAKLPMGARDLSFLLSLGMPLGALVASVSVRQSLSEEVEKLTQQLADRKLVERAKGLLQSKLEWTEEQAYFYVRRLSRQRRTAMRHVAQEVIEAGGLCDAGPRTALGQ